MTSLPIPSLPFPLSESLRQQARDELGNRIAADAFRTGEFILTSGKKSDYYIDGKQVTLSPSAALAALLILDIIQDDGAVAVGGMSIGADPIAGAVTALSYLTPRPVNGFMVRKEAKGHGMRRQVEGPPLKEGDRVVIVEDVITTGGSSRDAIAAVEAQGAQVARVVVLVDRQQGGVQALEALGYTVSPLFTIEEIRERARRLPASQPEQPS